MTCPCPFTIQMRSTGASQPVERNLLVGRQRGGAGELGGRITVLLREALLHAQIGNTCDQRAQDGQRCDKQQRQTQAKGHQAHRVANPSHSADERVARRIELLAQRRDEEIDDLGATRIVVCPDALVDLLPGEHPPGRVHQERQQVEFPCREARRSARRGALPAPRGSLGPGRLRAMTHRRTAGAWSARSRASNSSMANGLAGCVIGTGVKADDPIADPVHRGEHQDGRTGSRRGAPGDTRSARRDPAGERRGRGDQRARGLRARVRAAPLGAAARDAPGGDPIERADLGRRGRPSPARRPRSSTS